MNDIDEKLIILDKLIDSDSSLDKFLDEYTDSKLSIINEDKLNESIFNYIKDNDYKEMKNVTDIVTKKENKFIKEFMDVCKIGFVTCVCVMLTILMTKNEDILNSYMSLDDDIKMQQKIDEKFYSVSNYVKQPLSQINKEEE